MSGHRRTFVITITAVLSAVQAYGSIYLGSNASGDNPLIQVLDPTGSFLGNVGPNPASAAVPDGMGHLFTVTPGNDASVVTVYDENQNQVSSFTFNGGTDDAMGSGNYLTDLAWGGSSLWASAYNGYIYQLSPTGAVLNSFNTDSQFTGITSDGAHLYTTSGLGLDNPAPFVYQRDLAGAILATINTGLNDTLGIGFDKSTGNLFIGGIDVVSEVTPDGTIVSTFANAGVHTGVEVGDIGTSPSGVPEPATVLLIGGGLLAIALMRARRFRMGVGVGVAGGLLGLAVSGWAAVSISSFSASMNAPAPVGTPITFTANASDSVPGSLVYRYRVSRNGGALSTFIDYGPSKTFRWVPTDSEGNYDIEVSVLNRSTGSTATANLPFAIASRVAGGTPVVTATNHPLVALYSAPACTAGAVMRVRFKNASQAYWNSTSKKTCDGTTSMNFLVAGMYASTTYTMRNDVISGPQIATSSDVTFATGAASPTLPATTVPIPLKPPTSLNDGLTLFGPLSMFAYAVDPTARLVWYLPDTYVDLVRVAPGGTFTVVYGLNSDLPNSGFTEYDLAGNVIKRTNIDEVNAKLASQLHVTYTITAIHHDVRRLPNGNYLMLGQTEVISGVQNAGTSTDILGDVIMVMNNNLDLLWAWNSFDHLDVARRAVLNETCSTGVAGCVVLKAAIANDWTHGNSIAISPDGNIIFSSRHQDFVYKIAYNNGTGDGHVIWRLGKDGDFSWLSSDPYPWQSHQHDAEYEASNVLSLFDNGNTRVAQSGGHSRGQVLQINENSRTVTPWLNADLAVFSQALGSAQRLSNGSYSFDSGFIPGTQSSEVDSTGAIVGQLANNTNTYRTFRLRDLYSAPW